MISRILLLTVLFVWCSHGQAEQEPPVYRVEVIIFERSAASNREDRERWEKTIELAYPADWVRLVDPQEAEQIRIRQREEQEGFKLSEGFFQAIGEQSSPGSEESEETDDSSEEPAELAEPFYRFLPEEQKTLKQSAQALNRAGHLRTLLHETWLQPMGPENQSPGLIVRGGNLYGDHAELEGYIRLSLSRYLHLQTNLWFTEFVPNYGQMPEHWPELPQFPENYLTSEELPPSQDNLSLFDHASALSLQNGSNSYFNLSDQKLGEAMRDGEENEQEPYLIQQTVTLQQKRRMRSEELHYIDHPRLGILIKIYPHSTKTQTSEGNE